MNKQHTSGNWYQVRHKRLDGKPGTLKIENGQTVVAELPWREEEEWMANARLIAAAPDLLNALKDLLCECENKKGTLLCPSWVTIVVAKEAVRKAVGI